jgi:nitrate/nitrite transporter NarK
VLAFVACVLSVLGGYLADRIPPRHLLSGSMVLMALAIVVLLAVQSPLAALAYSALLGMHTGIQRCSGSVTLINFFGRLHFGSVNGIAMSLVIGAAALGPLPLALAQDFLGGYEPALRLLLLFPLASAAAVWSAHPPGTPGLRADGAVPAT